MKLGVRNIKWIPASDVEDFSTLPPGASFNLAAFLKADLKELPFTPESADISESWRYDDNGKYSEFSFAASIRADREKYRSTLQLLTGKKAIFVIELISGVKYVVGSREYVPTFTFSDGISGISTSGFSINITNKSLHGVLLAL